MLDDPNNAQPTDGATPSAEEVTSSTAAAAPAHSNKMKPLTAAKKLGIYLPATPPEFQANPLSHGEFVELQKNPPQWLLDLRRNGPHPRPEVARKLGITITALKNNNLDQPLTTADIKALLENQPTWLRSARKSLADERENQSPS